MHILNAQKNHLQAAVCSSDNHIDNPYVLSSVVTQNH
jgi:hypothetical protein